MSQFYYIKRQFFKRQSILKIGKITPKHSTFSLVFTFKGCRQMCNVCTNCAHGECLHVCMWLCTPRYICTCMFTDMETRGWHWITANLIFSDRVSQWTWNSLSKASQPENTRSLCLMGLSSEYKCILTHLLYCESAEEPNPGFYAFGTSTLRASSTGKPAAGSEYRLSYQGWKICVQVSGSCHHPHRHSSEACTLASDHIPQRGYSPQKHQHISHELQDTLLQVGLSDLPLKRKTKNMFFSNANTIESSTFVIPQ